jgi:dienelactone hydrolase
MFAVAFAHMALAQVRTQESAAPALWRIDVGAEMVRAVLDTAGGEGIPGAAAGTISFDRGSATLRFPDHGDHLTFGPDPRLGVRDDESFALRMRVRTTNPGFATALMCREGSAVHYSFVIGRNPGTIAFEAWNWSKDRAESATRIDDGEWHEVVGAYDATRRSLILAIDGMIESEVATTSGFRGSAAPSLRLGENLDSGVRQPLRGELASIAMYSAIPPELARRRAELASLHVLEPGEAERAVIAWNDRLRAPRVPDSRDADRIADETRRTRALVQDALGLWPPPYSRERNEGMGTPLSDPRLRSSTAFREFQPDLPLEVSYGARHATAQWSVERVYWQSFRGFRASGWLYRQNGDAAPRSRPAVLSPHGHWRHGAIEDVVQFRCIGLARLGYVVLAVDSIHFEDPRIGLSSLSVMTWNNLRGLEVLRELPEVDPDRIGCTGASGGGQQTYYLTALDSGLAAAVPAVMACHFGEITQATSPHCHCNHTPHLAFAVDMPHMAAAFAPRPQLFLTVSGDWTHAFHQFGFPEVRATYERLGVPDATELRRWNKGHTYDRDMRNAMYAFFERHLRGAESSTVDFEAEPPVALSIDAMRRLDREGVVADREAIRREFLERLVRPEPSREQLADAEFVDTIRHRLRGLIHEQADRDGVREPILVDSDPARRLARWRVPTEHGVHLPVVVIGERAEAASRIVLLLHPRGKAFARVQHREWIEQLVDRGTIVVLADLRYCGELDVGRNWRDLHGRFFGRDEGQVQVRDVRVLLDFLPRVAPLASIEVVADDWLGASALLASALHAPIDRLILPDLGADWIDGDRRPRLARILLHADLADAAFASAANRLVIGGGARSALWTHVASSAGARIHRTMEPLSVGDVGRLLSIGR